MNVVPPLDQEHRSSLVSTWPLPAEVVWAAGPGMTPARRGDLRAGMPPEAMVHVVARLDVAAGLAAAVAARHLVARAHRGDSKVPWAQDPPVPCCAQAISTLAHRASFSHLAHLHVGLLTEAVNDLRAQRLHDHAPAALVDSAFDEVLAHAQALAVEVVDVLDEMERRAGAGAGGRDLLYLVPFVALNVPVARARTYERYGVPWPVALTWETYCPLEPAEGEALFGAVAASMQPAPGVRSASLRVVH